MTATRSVVIERELAHPREKVWRAITRGELLNQWLMTNDFEPVVGQRFQFRANTTSTLPSDWDGLIDCEVLVVEREEKLAYTWYARGLESVITWTLQATAGGTLLRMEQSGFRLDQVAAYNGATYAWKKFMAELERVITALK